VDLGAPQPLSRVVILWETALGKDYLVQGSTDNATWTTLKTVTGNTEQFNEHLNLDVTARYLKIKGTARGTAYGFSIREIMAYGSMPLAAGQPLAVAAPVQVYPNPAGASLAVALGPEWPAATQLTVLDPAGRVVASQLAGPATGPTRPLPTAGLAPGLYLLRVQRPGASQAVRFVKE